MLIQKATVNMTNLTLLVLPFSVYKQNLYFLYKIPKRDRLRERVQRIKRRSERIHDDATSGQNKTGNNYQIYPKKS